MTVSAQEQAMIVLMVVQATIALQQVKEMILSLLGLEMIQ
jgi:hypothetical protein